MVIRPGLGGRRLHRAATTPAVATAALAVALAGAGLAGCSSGSSSKPAAAATAVPGAPPPVPSYDPKKGARSDASAGRCGPDRKGGWAFVGTVKNSATSARSYQIVVDFVTDKGSTVVDTQVVTLSGVAPDATKDWSAQGAAGKAKDDLRCVIRSVQFG